MSFVDTPEVDKIVDFIGEQRWLPAGIPAARIHR